jgi:putative nucleotidyltransferase with HDIG domain
MSVPLEQRPSNQRLGGRPGAPTPPTALWLYDAVLLAIAVSVLVNAATHLEEALLLTHPEQLWRLAGFTVAAVIVNLWSLQMPGYGAIHVADALYLGLLPVVGLHATCLVVLVAGLVKALRDLLLFKREPVFVAYSFLHPVVSFGLGGAVYQLTAAPGLVLQAQNVGALGLTALVIAILQAAMSAMAKVLHRDLQFYVQMIPLHRVRLYVLILAPLGLLVATLTEVAPIGLWCLILPVAMIYRSLKNYTELLLEARSTIEEMAEAVEKRDPYTHEHSKRVAAYAESMARQLRLPEEDVDAIVSAGKLHDLGKISVADNILLKMEALDEDEYEEIKRHPEVGGQVASKFEMFTRHGDIAGLIRQHHEWWNGQGYPDQLKGTEILLGARILAVAEAWDTMTTSRSYRAALPTEEALEKLKTASGIQFDPKVVEAFVQVIKQKET